MIVDRRKDHYDELLVLARDARTARERTGRWTTGLIVAAMATSGAYVAAMNNKVDDLRVVKEAADAEVFRLNIDLGRLAGEHEALRAERDIYRQNAEWFAGIAPSLNAADRLGDIANSLGGTSTGSGTPAAQAPDFALSNLVWYVDGSRRFPMAARDVLWIPEGQFWVKLEEPDSAGSLPTHITVHFGDRPSASGPVPAESLGPFRLDGGRYYERRVTRGNANCVKLELDNRTGRPVFGTGYVDMIVTYSNNSNCADGPVAPQE